MTFAQTLRRIMYALIYPVVLGAGLLVLGEAVVSHPSPRALLAPAPNLGVVYMVIMSFAFVAGESSGDYRVTAFVLDLLEVGLVFGGMLRLGLVDSHAMPAQHLRSGYYLLAGCLAIEPAWRLVTGHELKWRHQWLRIVALVLLVSAGAWVDQAFRYMVNAVLILLCASYVTHDLWLARRGRLG